MGRYGIGRVGFLTLTFSDQVVDAREAQRRFNSLRTHVLAERYSDYIRVHERQKSGRIHYHLLVALDRDIREGIDFEALARRDYRTAPAALRDEWAFWRGTAPRYGFGRTELLPVVSNAQAMGRYVGKYIGKHLGAREERDKGVRLVQCSSGARAASSRFQFVTEGSAEWRRKVATFALMVSQAQGVHIGCLEDLNRHFGSRWMYRHRDFIASLPPLDD